MQGSTICTVSTTSGQASTVSVIAGVSNTATHVCRIEVTLPVFDNSALVAYATVDAVLLESLVLRAQDYDYTSVQGTLAAVAASTTTPATLQQISCNSSDYEQVSF